jgi:acetyl/propionyl-CoA carboxylase alpha subunit/acetyl-CoA carboxylase carboxyltransferase component
VPNEESGVFERIAIVNRGEPAMRLIHTVRALRDADGTGPRTVALHTDAERDAMFVREADDAVRIGPGPGEAAWPRSPYLDHDELARALQAANVDAAWVGWGFVAEHADFADRCEQLGIAFVGPTGDTMRALGDKIGAKLLAERSGVPVAPWSNGPVHDLEAAREHAERIGVPLVVKATAGGGGRGIRVCRDLDTLETAFTRARAEAGAAFGDETVFLERMLTGARHVEVQILADGQGAVWAAGTRDCSLQRRNQKVLEESASTALTAEQDADLRTAAAALARTAAYRGAGTVEFLHQPATGLTAFLEVNTRLQVEHPVTELTTGLDLVEWQLRIAAGERLPAEHPPAASGHAIEVRLNAEDPERGFAPAAGRIELLTLPAGPGIRVDTGVAEGDRIPPEYDSMVAKILAHGADRDTAIRRLRRALAQTTVLVEGGTTNRAFLLDLLSDADVLAGAIDTGWLDRRTADGYRFTTRGDVALVAAAIDAYDEASTYDRTRFYASAARGRPQIAPELPRAIDLRYDGVAYRLEVACTGPGRYLVATNGTRVLATVEGLRRYERRLTIESHRFRVVAIRQGADQLVEVDGVPHRVSQDDAGLVRAPAPSVVVSVNVAAGEPVTVGTTLAVLESMKMETPLTAPFAGTVVEVLTASNVQLDAGQPVLRLEPTAETGDAPVGELVDLTRLQRQRTSGEQDHLGVLDALRRAVLGYDLPDDTVRELIGVLEANGAPDDEVVRAELDVLRVHADIAALSRNRRLGDDEDRGEQRSAREHLHAFLRTFDVDALPGSFVAKLRRALAHYAISSLDRTPQLEEALFRIHLAQARSHAHVPVIVALLDRLLKAGPVPGGPLGEELRETLDRLILATQARQPVLGDLARRARYRCFDQPRLAAQREEVHTRARAHLRALADDPGGADRAERLQELIDTPEQLLGLLEDPEVAGGRLAPLLEVLTRRYYRTRELDTVRTVEVAGGQAVVADFSDPRGHGRVIALAATADDLSESLQATADLASEVDPAAAGAGVVADVYIAWPDAPTELDLLSAGLEADLDDAALPPALRRVTLSLTVAPGIDPDDPERPSVEHLTFRRDDSGRFQERRHLRGIHPLIAGRLDLWRFERFAMTRLPSSERTYLFHARAHDNPQDERLFVIAEVRDLTPVRDPAGKVVALPELEQVLASALDDLRRARAASPTSNGPEWNRIMLHVWPPVELPIQELEPVIRAVAPTTEGLGLEQVTVQARLTRPDAEPEEVVVRMSRPPGQGFTLRVTPPPIAPLAPFDAMTRQVMKARSRGSVYPYELVPLLTRDRAVSPAADAGGFVEYDLDGSGRLVPVQRPFGGNRAGIVVGLVTTRTDRYPEGMTRVALFGDPTKGLGSIATTECALICQAIDLAAERGAPIEWFAVSSGARIAMDSGTENMDGVARVLRAIIEFTQQGGQINVVVSGINVGAQPYWNAEATMLMHTKGILVMTPDSAMVLTGKQALDYSGGVSAEDNFGIGGYDRVMGPNGQAQHWAPDLASAIEVLFAHYEHSYVAPGERFPRPAPTTDDRQRDIRSYPHRIEGLGFATVGEVFDERTNPGRKKPFDIRTVLRAVSDLDHEPLERWKDMADAEVAVVTDAHLGGYPVTLLGIESRPLPRQGPVPADGPDGWTAGTLFPRASKKVARAINAASGIRPVVVLANLSGFDGSPESLRELQLELGAEIGRAVVNFDGPIVFCVISRYHGGAFVVFSKALNDHLEVAAVEGSHASVIGGPPAAAVVFAGEVQRRTDADERLVTLRERIATAEPLDQGRLRTALAELRSEVRAEKLGEVAAEFDRVHSIERARQVGSVDQIVAPGQLRAYLIEAVERGMARITGPAGVAVGTGR